MGLDTETEGVDSDPHILEIALARTSARGVR
jgi:hypothetical protein